MSKKAISALIFSSLMVSIFFSACSEGKETVVQSYSDYQLNGVLVKDGYFTDKRNNHKYRIMEYTDYASSSIRYLMFAENLNYVDSTLQDGSWCYENSEDSCEVYGRLYNWEAAQNACPEGWSLPSYDDWRQLMSRSNSNYEHAGRQLKTIDHWLNADSVYRGTNRVGFYGLPSGRKNVEGGWLPTGKFAYFWSSEAMDSEIAYGWHLSYESDEFLSGDYYKGHGMSVRCMKSFSLWGSSDVRLEGALDSSFLDEIPVNFGTLEYQGQTYKTVEVGGVEYMAENMNYETGNSWCYNNSADSCKKYGRLYDKETAETICPEGWRLPVTQSYYLDDMWAALYNSMSTPTALGDYLAEGIKSTDSWVKMPGTNRSGFNLRPSGGYDISSETFFDVGYTAYLWATLDNAMEVKTISIALGYSDDSFSEKNNGSDFAYAVRCVKQ